MYTILIVEDDAGIAGAVSYTHLDVYKRQGLNGAGKTETFRAITGADKILEGKITLNGQDITNRSIGECQSRGLMYVTEDLSLIHI